MRTFLGISCAEWGYLSVTCGILGLVGLGASSTALPLILLALGCGAAVAGSFRALQERPS